MHRLDDNAIFYWRISMNIVRINLKNQINIPKEIVEQVNFGTERYVQVIADQNNIIHLIPVAPEPLFSKKALDGLDALVEKERDAAQEIKTPQDIRQIFKRL